MTAGGKQTKAIGPPGPAHAVAADSRAAPPSAEAQRFADLTAEVERHRAALAHWKAQRDAFEQAYARSVAPLWRELSVARLVAVRALERQLDAPGWNRAERAGLLDLLANRSAELRGNADGSRGDDGHEDSGEDLGAHDGGVNDDSADDDSADDDSAHDDGANDAGLAGSPVRQAEVDVSGFEVSGFEVSGFEADLQRRCEARDAHATVRRQARQARRLAGRAVDAHAGSALAGQSLRDVFRRLANALHPDRETDPARRSAKTALMQQANRAHGEKDLRALLELQGRIGAAAGPTSADPQRLVHDNRLLADQCAQLAAQLDRLEADFRREIGLPPGRGLKPARMVGYAKQDARHLRERLAAVRTEALLFDDAAMLREWLRARRRRAAR